MLANLATNPIPLGKLMAGATFATVSIPLITNLVGTYPDIASGGFGTVHIEADADNSTFLYLCNTSAAPDVTNWTNILQKIFAGGSIDLNAYSLNNVPVTSLYIGALNATDFAMGYLLQR